MTTCAAIDAAWLTGVWQHATIKAITPICFQFGFTQESEPEISRGMYGTELNFFEAVSARENVFEMTGGLVYHFTVEVSYYIEQDTTGEAWTDVRNAFESLFTVVRESLGATWGDTVDFWRPQEGPPEIEETTLGSANCWRGNYKFFATKQISIS